MQRKSHSYFPGSQVISAFTRTCGEVVGSNVSPFPTVKFNTVVRANTAGAFQTIDGDINISGNLVVLGTQTVVESTAVTINDPLLFLANNNTQDVLDIGTIGQYSPDGGSTILRTGVYRHAGDQQYYVFDGYSGDISANTVNPGDTSFHLATLNANLTAPTANLTQANITTANVSGDIGVVGSAYVGTNLVVTGTTTLTGQANTTNDLGVGGNAYVTDSATVGQQLFVNNLTNANTNYVVYYDTSTKELKYDSLDTLAPDNLANGSSYFAVSSDGYAYSSGKILAAQSVGTVNGGFSFTGNEGGYDTGMFSPTDGQLGFYTNNVEYFRVDINTGYNYTYVPLVLANGAVLKDESNDAVAFGEGAGTTNQGLKSVAIGFGAGNTNQDFLSVAIGDNAGNLNQGHSSVALGHTAGRNYQGTDAVAIGVAAGQASQGNYAVAIGERAGYGDNTSQGVYAIAIGAHAGYSDQYQNSIILNASGNDLNSYSSGLFIDPIAYTASQDATYDGLMFYNADTKEVRYSYTLDGGSF